jgi:hypothetical protein
MSEIKWEDQVQVQILEPTGIEDYQVVEESVIKWGGIDLAERSTLFSGRTASVWRFRLRKTGICGWSRVDVRFASRRAVERPA